MFLGVFSLKPTNVSVHSLIRLECSRGLVFMAHSAFIIVQVKDWWHAVA
jgi:hypothetical protein